MGNPAKLAFSNKATLPVTPTNTKLRNKHPYLVIPQLEELFHQLKELISYHFKRNQPPYFCYSSVLSNKRIVSKILGFTSILFALHFTNALSQQKPFHKTTQ